MENNPLETTNFAKDSLESYLSFCTETRQALDALMERYSFGNYYVDRSGLSVCVDFVKNSKIYKELYVAINTDLEWQTDIRSFMDYVRTYYNTDYCESHYNHIKNWNEEKYETCKKLYKYFLEVNIQNLEGNWYGTSKQLSSFKKYFLNEVGFEKNTPIDFETYNSVINSDVAVRFLNALNQESTFTPGQFVLVKLGKMPQRIVETMPQQNQNYINKKGGNNLVSAGIILDVVKNKEIKVRNKGSWYKVAIATPFSIFCLEERHLKKYNPTKEYVEKLIVSYNEAKS